MHFGQLLEMGTPPLTWDEMSSRGLVAFAYGTLIVRLFGRRIFARWSALDVVIAVTMGSTLSRAITGPVPFWPAILATTVMILVHRGLALVSARSPSVSRLLEGRAVILAQDGAVNEQVMAAHGVSAADLREALRIHDLETVGQTRQISLEPSGSISIRPALPRKPSADIPSSQAPPPR